MSVQLKVRTTNILNRNKYINYSVIIIMLQMIHVCIVQLPFYHDFIIVLYRDVCYSVIGKIHRLCVNVIFSCVCNYIPGGHCSNIYTWWSLF